MNLVKSANDRAKEAAIKAAQQEQRDHKIKQERVAIRLNLLQNAKEGSQAIANEAWEMIKDKDYPEITFYAQAMFVFLKNDDFPTVERLEKVVEFLRNDSI